MNTLFSIPRIPRVAFVTDVDHTPLGQSQPTYATDEHGNRWIRKYEDNTHVQEFIAESVGFLLGTELGAPLPRVAFHDDDKGERSWLSSYIFPSKSWHESLASFVVNLDELGALLAVDALIGNSDRHEDNLVCHTLGDMGHVRVVGIDFGMSIVGDIRIFYDSPKQIPDLRHHATGIPIGLVTEGALAAARKAQELASESLVAIAVEACEIGRSKHCAMLAQKLQVRCASAPDIVTRHLLALGGRQ